MLCTAVGLAVFGSLDYWGSPAHTMGTSVMSSLKINPSVSIPMRAIVAMGLQQGEKCTLIAILALAREKDGFAPVTAKILEAVLAVSHWTLRRHIRELEAKGFIYRGHQYEHKALVGGCPWDGCYGIFTAFAPSGRLLPWAQDSPVGASNWQSETQSRLSVV